MSFKELQEHHGPNLRLGGLGAQLAPRSGLRRRARGVPWQAVRSRRTCMNIVNKYIRMYIYIPNYIHSKQAVQMSIDSEMHSWLRM